MNILACMLLDGFIDQSIVYLLSSFFTKWKSSLQSHKKWRCYKIMINYQAMTVNWWKNQQHHSAASAHELPHAPNFLSPNAWYLSSAERQQAVASHPHSHAPKAATAANFGNLSDPWKQIHLFFSKEASGIINVIAMTLLLYRFFLHNAKLRTNMLCYVFNLFQMLGLIVANWALVLASNAALFKSFFRIIRTTISFWCQCKELGLVAEEEVTCEKAEIFTILLLINATKASMPCCIIFSTFTWILSWQAVAVRE